MEGFTFPGMMLDPGCTAGSRISAKPVRGPDASRRKSPAIFPRSAAYVRRAPEKAAASPSDCINCTRSLPSRSSRPVIARRCLTMSAGYCGSALSPVPTAVPPMPRSRRSSAARVIRSRLRSTVCPNAVNSWPRRIGVASCRCVRPDFTILSNALPFARNARASRVSDSVSAASCDSAPSRMAVGITSLVDCAMLT